MYIESPIYINIWEPGLIDLQLGVRFRVVSEIWLRVLNLYANGHLHHAASRKLWEKAGQTTLN